jgi:small-conductance mechanosensitive channel
VVVKSLDGVEAIVPNETLVITTVLNHSYTSRDIRIGIPLQISYDSDVDKALRLMEEAALAETRVLRDPTPPTAFLVSFADSGINLELGIWIRDPEYGQLNLKSALNRRIYASFKANGVEIPYPRRDVRLIAMEAPATEIPSSEIPASPAAG